VDGFWGLAAGVLSSFIVMGLLPLFEHFFKVPTNISLLELSDLNHPLLKTLALEAPGTYHHSIMVGNLAEASCDAIGANSLLARVGAYYHDIGKISKPEYFSENEMGSGSRHANLTPSMSALIISKHVKDGIEIAHKYKLNQAIMDLITQHHGDSMISYFYQKAIEKSEDGSVLNEEDFRYPGPKPQTKEGAILLLADSVEASSRALEDPTPSSIRNLVRKIINNKFIDGQLDECDLTLRDMHKIADSFVRVLMAVFHTRLSYPEENKGGTDILANGNKNKLRRSKQ
ncbi:MAG: HDIG domain-containing protein, partial [Candidatus Omnitrophica bacterium]|nr:HDIG domain-containing protein [Candidatus Omnitrophota bacterium]